MAKIFDKCGILPYKIRIILKKYKALI